MVLETDRALPTAVPEKSIAFIRAQDLPPPQVLPRDAEEKESPSDHYIVGRPRVTKPDRFAFQPAPGGPLVEGVTILKKHAFTIGHYDKHKTLVWVAMRWTKEHLDISEKEPSHPRNFQADTELPSYARTGKDYQHPEFGYERGHMARHEDLSGFPAPGEPRRGTREGCLMSNIAPQQRKGHVVADPSKGIKSVWLISGPVFLNGQAEKVIGPDRVGGPHAVYKFIGWQKAGGGFTARGYAQAVSMFEPYEKVQESDPGRRRR